MLVIQVVQQSSILHMHMYTIAHQILVLQSSIYVHYNICTSIVVFFRSSRG